MVVAKSSKTILILHRSLVMQLFISDELSSFGGNIVTAESAGTASRLLQEHLIDVVIAEAEQFGALISVVEKRRCRDGRPKVILVGEPEIGSVDGPAVAGMARHMSEVDFFLASPIVPELLRKVVSLV